MKTDKIETYSRLWDGSEVGWVLLRCASTSSGFSICNEISKTVLHIEDVAIAIGVCDKLLASGSKILDEIEPGEVGVEPID